MIEIRAEDLRFSDAETEVLNEVLRQGLTAKDMTRLEERTEGWIAGLQMAAVALKGISQEKPDEVSLFVKTLRGATAMFWTIWWRKCSATNREEVQEFLFGHRYWRACNGSLCDAVTGTSWGQRKGRSHRANQMLEYLERSNLFVVSLDTDRLRTVTTIFLRTSACQAGTERLPAGARAPHAVVRLERAEPTNSRG